MTSTSSQPSGIINSIYTSRKIILDQLKEQKYDISNYNEFSITEIGTMAQNKQLDFVLDHTELNQKVYIKYNIWKTLSPSNIHEIIEDLYNLEQILTKKDNLIIIIKSEPNDTLLNTVKQIYALENIHIVLYPLKRLQFNILEHSLVPKHTLLNEDEKNDFKKKYNITNLNQIPTISRFDPVAMAICMKPDDICHISRPSQNAVHGNYYRICVNE
jgi:DNA-directed RNA polymerase I, II, and III subunit RPABC1